jgi:hypothetical protein
MSIEPFQPIGRVAARVVDGLGAVIIPLPLRSKRRDRDMDRGRRAADKVRAAGGSAMDAALAQIGATFCKAEAINAFKMRVEIALQRGAEHPDVRARYGARAYQLRRDTIDGALNTLDYWLRIEKRKFECATRLGRGNRLSLDVLAEARLILRFVRRYHRASYPRHLAGLGVVASLQAAE